MGLKSFLFEAENAPRRCLILIIVIFCISILAVWDGGGSNLKTDGPIVKLESKAVLRQRFDRDTICTRLVAGDSVKVLGIDRSSFGQKWLVETDGGDIGWIDASDITAIRQIVIDGADKGDTVSIKAEWSGSYIYYYSYIKDGEENKKSTDDFMPDLDGWDDYAFNADGRAGVCSQRKFEKKVSGKTFKEVNDEFGLPVLLHGTPQGFVAQYSWKAFNPSTGEMFKPNVTFGTDSVASAVDFVLPTNRAASWLKHIPFAVDIIDCPLSSLYIRGARYDFMSNPLPSTAVWILIPILLFMYFCWMFMAQTIPVLLMGWLLKFPGVFKPLSDMWLKILMFVLSLICFYIQSVVMMAWGMFPFWSIIILIMSLYTFSLATSPLITYPHVRCPRCRHLYTIRFNREEFEYSEIQKGIDIVRDKLLGTRKEKWQKWTEVTTTTKYRDGHTTSSKHRENVRNMARDIKTYQFIDYEVTYRLDHYRQYYICSKCGLVEETTSVRYTEIDRKVAGAHTGEVAGEEYDNGFGW